MNEPTLEEDLAEGHRRADEGAHVAADAVDTRWLLGARAALRRLAHTGREFSADTLREIVGPPLGSPNAVGSVFRQAAKSGLIRHVGWTTSTRPETHARPVRVWKGTR